MLLWTFLAGGALDRLARQRWMGGAGFLAAGRRHFWPLTRLALLAGALYWLLFGVLRPWLFGDPPGASATGPGNGAYADAAWLALNGLFAAGRAGIGLVVDYARVRAVVEDRRSAIGALLAALRFMVRRPAPVAGLWVLNAALLALILAGCSLVAPAAMGVGRMGPFLVGQLYIAAHLLRDARGLGVADGVLPGPARARHLRRASPCHRRRGTCWPLRRRALNPPSVVQVSERARLPGRASMHAIQRQSVSVAAALSVLIGMTGGTEAAAQSPEQLKQAVERELRGTARCAGSTCRWPATRSR